MRASALVQALSAVALLPSRAWGRACVHAYASAVGSNIVADADLTSPLGTCGGSYEEVCSGWLEADERCSDVMSASQKCVL